MFSRILLSLAAVALVWAGPKKLTGSGRGENQDIILTVTVYADPESVKEVLGDDLGGHFIVAEVNVQPKYGKEISIDRDDFVLRTDHNGDKTGPMAPSEIAGRGALVLTEMTGQRGPGGDEPIHSWSLGGVVGGGTAGGGSPGTQPTAVTQAKMQQSGQDRPIKKVLDAKQLADGKVEKPVAGLLYFPMERQKVKDLEMIYGAHETRISIRFK
ncbi:MAG: hypothetical protein KGN36_02275 [Acidobacteriota bacterium]|nr:hypothetical protein [Acidobacteriota bacterium]